MKPEQITAKNAYDIAKSVDLQSSFKTENVTHNLKDILETIETEAKSGAFSTDGNIIRLNNDLIQTIECLGYKVDCVYVDSPISCGKKILIRHIISWDELKNQPDL